VYEIVDGNLVCGLQVGAVEDPGRSDDTGTAAEIGANRRQRLFDCIGVADVARIRAGRAADHRGSFGCVFGMPVEHGDAGAVASAALRSRASDATSTTTDYDDLFHGE